MINELINIPLIFKYVQSRYFLIVSFNCMLQLCLFLLLFKMLNFLYSQLLNLHLFFGEKWEM